MKLKLPSVHSLWISFVKVVSRFPLQVLVAIVATISWCYIVDVSRHTEEQLAVFLSVCNLALTLLLAVDLYAEANKLKSARQWALRLAVVLICTVLYFVLKPSFYLADVFRIGLLAFAFHLLVAFAPFIRNGNANGFWQYNKTLFLRILTSALYAGVLFAGLAIALVAIDGLFNVNIGWKTYMRLFAVVTAGFMTVFFLAGVPDDFEELNKDESYPKGLKIFTQYVLIPLMTIYLLILLVYEAKIMINWVLPKGLVSTLILGYAVFGILSLLLIYPIKEKEGNGWMKLFSRFFYVMMIPLVVLLLLAVWKRVGNYGITESRYILIVLAVWLTLITVYFLISKKQNIKIIPVSLCVLALLATYGPQSAFSVSKYSQVARLKRLMASKNQKDIDQRGAVVNYLVDRHGLSTLQPFTKVNLEELETKIEAKDTTQSRYAIKSKKTDTAYALLNIKTVGRRYMDYVRFVPQDESIVNVRGYDYVIPIESYAEQNTTKINNQLVVVEKVRQTGNLTVKVGAELQAEFDLRKLAEDAVKAFKTGKLKERPNGGNAYYLPEDSLSLAQNLNNYELKLMIMSLNTSSNTEDAEELNSQLSYNGYLLIRVK
ncbi:MAG: DUF4153 domain-containing protein [Candidatus Pedobacter colombiensis]|uniref:DUF4153 domain-containing protein n=1 Tax=Candidatus Pedobacter colombiensis TaxID=3121371 RepID=A0AAJ6B742_9SPHI|nr:DUF4153 domain-containing protein [Pedobacter sp.]WEK19126.1 MAG: DUF4153 domain-containing protein [Pedobacter sp.]